MSTRLYHRDAGTEYPPEYLLERQQLFSVRFIDEQQPAGGVVSQPHNEMIHKSRYWTVDTVDIVHKAQKLHINNSSSNNTNNPEIQKAFIITIVSTLL